MISIFQIFRVLIGSIVLIFVLIFFFRVSNLYTSMQEMGGLLETVNAFDDVAKQTYTSGNPGTFPGFVDFETLVYDPPKIKSDAGQRTLSVPVFLVPGNGKLLLEKGCSDFVWYKYCWVYAFPEDMDVLFTFPENTAGTRDLAREVAGKLPEGIEYGYCNGSNAQVSTKANFLTYLNTIGGSVYVPCDIQAGGHYRIVSLGPAPANSSLQNIAENDVFIDISSATMTEYSRGTEKSGSYKNSLDVAVFIIGGKAGLDYKNKVLKTELEIAAGLERKRAVLVHQNMKIYNKQPCQECSTPFPKACGWMGYDGHKHESIYYINLIQSLSALEAVLGSDSYGMLLDNTVSKYDELKNQGCE